MYSTIALISGLAAISSAAPAVLETRQDACSAYPWFITPYPENGCTGTPPMYQPTSGPATNPPVEQTCQPLSSPAGTSYPSVAVNPNACAGDTFTITLFATSDCSDGGYNVTANQCQPQFDAPWVSFSAIPNFA